MTKIIILQQTHASKTLRKSYPNIPDFLLPALEAVAESQFKLIKFVQNKKNIPVIAENSPSIRHGDMNHGNHVAYVTHLFPNGLTETFAQLNAEQVKYLGIYGAKFYLPHQSIIDQTYSDYSDKTGLFDNKYKKDTSFKNTGKIHQEREYLSLLQAMQVAKDTKSEAVILMYGRNHKFIDVAKCFPSIQVTVKDLSVDIPKYLYIERSIARPLVSCNQLENLGKIFGYTLPLAPAKQEIAPHHLPDPSPKTQSMTDSASNLVMYGTLALGGLLLAGLFGRCCSRRKSHVNKRKNHTDSRQLRL